jgi:hypothetical protein
MDMSIAMQNNNRKAADSSLPRVTEGFQILNGKIAKKG